MNLVVGVAGDNSPFDSPQASVPISPYPQIGPIVHQDWSGLVTSASPPHANEVLHFYMIDLGAVNPEVQPGVAAPSVEPLSRLATPMVCTSWTVLYAGLAPGDTWRVYQVDLQLGPQTGQLTNVCSLDGGKTWFAMPFFTVAP